ncbi:MAG: alpha-L-fucosidase [Ignavibacteriales bacterium]|nr:alpha-L-fucosidase [Ignavibacteriales bacterium]
MRTRPAAAAILCLLALGLAAPARAVPGPGQTQAADRLQWFRDAKFGLFIHWGVYSMIGREEWARQLLQIPLAQYQDYADNFDPVDFNPDEWAALAKEAGVKYVVITSKHHDGFAIFDSAVHRLRHHARQVRPGHPRPALGLDEEGRHPARVLLLHHGLAPPRLPAPPALGEGPDGRRAPTSAATWTSP